MNIPSNWITWFVVIFCLIFGYTLISRLLRLKGKPGGLIEPPLEDILFDESYASARSHKSLYTRLGSGARCMRISITKNTLYIRPHFPFSLIGSDADLIHEIPLSNISDISAAAKSGSSVITVHFGNDQRVDLVLKHSEKFLSIIKPTV